MKHVKYIAIAGIVFPLFSFAFPGKYKKPTLPPNGFFGHIHWVQATMYHALMDSSGNIVKGAMISDTDMYGNHQPMTKLPTEAWAYDEYGDQLEHDKYYANGKLFSQLVHRYYPDGDVQEIIDSTTNPVYKRIWKYTYKYDNSGNMLDSTACYYDDNAPMKLYSRSMNMYASNGKLLETYIFSGDTVIPTNLTLYRYNDEGQLIEIGESLIQNGNLKDLVPTEKTDFWYDKKGRMTDKATYRFHEGLVEDIKKTFDSIGYQVVTYHYAGNRMLKGSEVKSFFKATRTMQEDRYDADGMMTDYTISHLDSAGHVMDEGTFHITYNKGKKNDTAMVHHLVDDDHYNVVEDDHFSNDGETISHKSYQYTYDNTGNWTERIEFYNNKPVKIIEREIGYYKD